MLLDVGGFALTNVLAPVGVAVLTTRYLTGRRVGDQLDDTDRRAAEINEDMRRWVHDRDWAARVRMNEITQQATAMGVAQGGAIRAGAGKVYRHVLHEYRDVLTAKDRALAEMLAAEGRAHSRRRRRAGRPAPRLELPADCLAIVERWRGLAEDDPSGPDVEPRVARVERTSRALPGRPEPTCTASAAATCPPRSASAATSRRPTSPGTEVGEKCPSCGAKVLTACPAAGRASAVTTTYASSSI